MINHTTFNLPLRRSDTPDIILQYKIKHTNEHTF